MEILLFICFYRFNSHYGNQLTEINGKIEGNNVQMKLIQTKIDENQKLSHERQELIGTLESNSKMYRLEITEIESIECPQDVDVEVMVGYWMLFLFS